MGMTAFKHTQEIPVNSSRPLSTIFLYQPKPPWSSLIRVLVFHIAMLSLVLGERVDHSEYRHRGDLHLVRGKDVHSLAWVVETTPGCSISSVTGDIKSNMATYGFKMHKTNQSKTRLSDGSVREKIVSRESKDVLTTDICDGSIPMQLFLKKQLTFFENMYILAHPYFSIFSHYKRKIRTRYKQKILNLHAIQTLNPNWRNSFTERNESYISKPTKILSYTKASNHTLTSSSPSQSRIRGSQYQETLTQNRDIFQKIERCVEWYLNRNPCVLYARQEILKPRMKRKKIKFSDPLYNEQWHLKNPEAGEYDLNVVGVWESGITGRGVTVCVIDDGLEWQHPDLRDNYNPAGSYDLNADDADPSPVKNGERNEHGTRCAGEIAAVTNSVCGVGVAYRANISGIRVLGGRMTDSMEAAAFIQGLDVNDIYSCSWGPDDDGRTVDGPHQLARRALEHGVTHGRKGYGAIYVVASGNGGRNKDNCNFDGYANSVFTVTIGAVDHRGRMPYYAEECAAMLAVTPSSGSQGRGIVTTDWRELSTSGCTRHHSGTSAAAPLAAAVVALALEVHPCLSWRDVQYLIALTSRKIDAGNSNWTRNGAGLHHSHQHGFGLVSASAMVSAAAVWESVPFSTTYTSQKMEVRMEIRMKNNVQKVEIGDKKQKGTGKIENRNKVREGKKDKGMEIHRSFKKITKGQDENRDSDKWGVIAQHTVDESTLLGYAMSTLEFVQVVVSINHQHRGSLCIELQCPSGTRSTLATPRANDNSTLGLVDWALGTVRCWGEIASGQYTLRISQVGHPEASGILKSWRLVLHGSPMTAFQFQDRRKLVERAVRGEAVNVNRSTLCHQPELNFHPFTPLPQRWLKVLVITGVFLVILAVFSSLEYIFCHNEEKQRLYLKLRDIAAGRAYYQPRRTGQDRQNQREAGERTQLAGGELRTNGEMPEEEESLLVTVSTDCEGGEAMSLVCVERIISPSPSCDADISSLDDDGTDDDAGTSDTVVPRDTTDAATDLTNDEFMSEADDDPTARERGAGLRGH